MKKLFLSFGLALALTGVAQAKTPPEVLKPYKEYRAALKKGDASEALKHAYAAWQQAETLIGDSKITGDLAQNYALVKDPNDDKAITKKQEEAYKRALELTSGYGDDAAAMYMERGVNLMNFYQLNNKSTKS